MNETSELELLLDLAKLLRKHGPESFERLARLVGTPKFAARFRSILEGAAGAARRAGIQDRGKPAPLPAPSDCRAALVGLCATEPEKSAQLINLFDELMSRRVLATMSELRSFALHSGVPPLTAKTRPKAVVELLSNLQSRPLPELQEIVARIPPPAPDNQGDRSLAGWARIIFDKELRTRRAE